MHDEADEHELLLHFFLLFFRCCCCGGGRLLLLLLVSESHYRFRRWRRLWRSRCCWRPGFEVCDLLLERGDVSLEVLALGLSRVLLLFHGLLLLLRRLLLGCRCLLLRIVLGLGHSFLLSGQCLGLQLAHCLSEALLLAVDLLVQCHDRLLLLLQLFLQFLFQICRRLPQVFFDLFLLFRLTFVSALPLP